MSSAIDELKAVACGYIDAAARELIEVSHAIHANPELNYAEHFAHDLLTSTIEGRGLSTTRHAYGVDTGFSASAGIAGPTVAVLCEYDALPGIGHACGHNIIAASGLGAGLAAAAVAERAGGTLRLLGTPAEEGGGGKILMARNGAFDGVDAAMMIHPADADLICMNTVALQEFAAHYSGRAAHAAAAPWEGRNALDAAVLGYVNVAALRQHIRPTERVHGVFIKGGDKANIVPAKTETSWIVRSTTIETLQPLKQRVVACLEGAASACGCTMSTEWNDVVYADMIDNQPMVAAYVANAAALGRRVADPRQVNKAIIGSTDMGNVSYLVPSIHPMIQVAPDGVAIHTEDFARWARSPDGDTAVIDGAKIMAMTVIDLWMGEGLLCAARNDFERRPRGVDVL